MENITLHKMKQGMSFTDCLIAIADGNIGLITMMPEVCNKAAEITKTDRSYYGILSILDVMEVYGNDLANLFSKLCKKEDVKLILIIWAIEVGFNQLNLKKNIPDFASVTTIKKIIEDLNAGKEVSYPFDEAKQFIEKNSPIRF
jgi:predicted nuclease of restriction endonuclease-like RecB superfamily